MKITEATTLAELQNYLKVCGDPFVTLMAGSQLTSSVPQRMHAVVHAPNVGTFSGDGDTAAEALEAAFIEFRRATLPAPLKLYADPNGGMPYAAAPFAASLEGHYPIIPRKELCHGCGHSSSDHPDESGCQFWHDKP